MSRSAGAGWSGARAEGARRDGAAHEQRARLQARRTRAGRVSRALRGDAGGRGADDCRAPAGRARSSASCACPTAASSPYLRRPRRAPSAATRSALGVRFELASGDAQRLDGAEPRRVPAAHARRLPRDGVRAARGAARWPARTRCALLAFLAPRGPLAVKGIQAAATLAPPKSFATTRFNGLHAYWLVDAVGAPAGVSLPLDAAGGDRRHGSGGRRGTCRRSTSSVGDQPARRARARRLAPVFQLAGPTIGPTTCDGCGPRIAHARRCRPARHRPRARGPRARRRLRLRPDAHAAGHRAVRRPAAALPLGGLRGVAPAPPHERAPRRSCRSSDAGAGVVRARRRPTRARWRRRRAAQGLQHDAVALGELLRVASCSAAASAAASSSKRSATRESRRAAARSTASVPRKSSAPSAVIVPPRRGPRATVATACSVTPAQATSASSSMSPEHSGEPSPPVAGCPPASHARACRSRTCRRSPR